MFHCLQDKPSSKRHLTTHESDISLEKGLDAFFTEAVKNDDASKLEEALKRESGKLASGETKRASYDALVTKLFHLVCALDCWECCELLLTGIRSFPVARIDAANSSEGRSGLHHACRNHSTRCIEVLLKHGASVSLKNKAALLPLEEALLSSKLESQEDVVSTPAANLVDSVRKKDLSAIQLLVPVCKDQLSSIACKLLKDLKVVALVSLLLTAGQVANAVPRSEVEVPGTVVDLLLSYILPPTPFSPVDVDGTGYKIKIASSGNSGKQSLKSVKPEKKTSAASDKSWILSKQNQQKFTAVPKQASPALPVRSFYSLQKRQDTPQGKDSLSIATKLLECVLLFYPRLTAHPQSSFSAPLIRACQGNDVKVVKLLLSSGAPVNEQDGDGNTPLHWILRQATPSNDRRVNLDIVQNLLDAGANTMLGNRLGATPIHTAAGHGHCDALCLMLKKDISGVNVIAATKETPLHYAAVNNHIHCAAVLLKYGANRNVCNLRNMKPCNLAPTREMYALLNVDEKTLKMHPWESLVALFGRSDGSPGCPAHPRTSKNAAAGSSNPTTKKGFVDARKVFVGGLPLYVTSEDLRDEMEYEYGEVHEAVVICYVETSGKVKSRGFGFVLFKQPETAVKAVKSRYTSIRGKKVEIKGCFPAQDGDDCGLPSKVAFTEKVASEAPAPDQAGTEEPVSLAPVTQAQGPALREEEAVDRAPVPAATATHWASTHTPVNATAFAYKTAGVEDSTFDDSLDLERLLTSIFSTEDAPVPKKVLEPEEKEFAEILSLLEVGKGNKGSSSSSTYYGGNRLDGYVRPAYSVSGLGI
ncbi:hypothetical protein SELMODRAFT_425682 [Selaginella moellendorffii]|uniref:RRM domain-containing protein n=1 Tax=Selaginella moellendorffii TaxID=88036 RepID=D8STY1_SELML|nr:uncharacterized protein LOC9642020 [Selaginella moellendorffii]EFJ12100.1 hypothetical protein SELMODRAFT_425682 [Selaginella moellendorffii]|eukprot:XP_002986770.1 uncharacterized protein LOC9642020 [Selaginella moellendorffii]